MEKCTFCVHRVEKGLEPSCVAGCPASALLFGDLEDPNSKVSQVLKQKPSFRLLEDAGTEPRVHYVGGQPPSVETRQIEEIVSRVES
jgi:molybdopterin-containing oxidoreductase family iron-sulfur binding subunit